MKKVKIILQQTAGGTFHVAKMTNAIHHCTHRVRGVPVNVNLGDYLEAPDADAVCSDRSVEVEVRACAND